MATKPCVVCKRYATQLRSLPTYATLRREWLVRLNLLEEEMEEVDERSARIQRGGGRARLCFRHFKEYKTDAMPVDVSLYSLILTI
jgi:hypothetical protein